MTTLTNKSFENKFKRESKGLGIPRWSTAVNLILKSEGKLPQKVN
jgi:hypothetical protein